MTTQEKERIIRGLYSSVNRSVRTGSAGMMSAPAAFKELFAGISEAFADCELTVDELRVSGDRVMARYTACGTQEKDFLGTLATNQQMVITGLDVFCLDGDRIVEYRNIAQQISIPKLSPPLSTVSGLN